MATNQKTKGWNPFKPSYYVEFVDTKAFITFVWLNYLNYTVKNNIKISKNNLAILQAIEKGYWIINGKVFRYGKELRLKLNKSTHGYFRFGIRMDDGSAYHVLIHRMVAFHKYGKRIFNTELQVRHLDSDQENNYEYNISIGTPKQNHMDKSPEMRMAMTIAASEINRKHNHNKILKLHRSGFSYKEIMRKLGITSKGTVSFIINKSMCSALDYTTANK